VTITSEDETPKLEGVVERDCEPARGDGSSVFEKDGLVESTLAEHAAEARETPFGSCSAACSAMADVVVELKDLSQRQSELSELFESKIRSDETQSKALEKLHDQLRDYKANFIRQEMMPLLRDLIYCYDFADDEAVRARKDATPQTSEGTARTFDHLRQMVADVLAKYDVEPFRISGSEFDRREQQCVRTVPTGETADDKKVAAVGAIGFRLGEQIVRKEQVTVYKYAPGTSSTIGSS
jgi:molecular chaperone GrpE (heat shock protein)